MMYFDTKKQAEADMFQDIGDYCIDNCRFAYLNDPEALAQYGRQYKDGCCGFYDKMIFVGPNHWAALIGCNYGH